MITTQSLLGFQLLIGLEGLNNEPINQEIKTNCYLLPCIHRCEVIFWATHRDMQALD